MHDYHIHTSLCNHAHGGMPEYIQQAAALGLTEICFLDHLTLHDKENRHTMSIEELPFYIQAVRRLQHHYRDIIEIKLGIELDFTPETIDQAMNIVDRFSFDAIGASVHFIDDRNIASRRMAANMEPLDTHSLWRQYMERIERLLEHSFFDFICHLDVPKKPGRQLPNELMKKFNEIIVKIRYKNISLEINTSGLDHPAGEIYPGEPWILQGLSLGIPMLIGSDAHRPEEVGGHLIQIIPRLNAMGLKQVASFTKRKRKTTPLTLPVRNVHR